MRQEIDLEWVLEVCKYLETDPNTTKAVLIDFYGVYVQEYVFDPNGLMEFDGNSPTITMHSIPVNQEPLPV